MTHPAETLPCPYCPAKGGEPCMHLTTAGTFPVRPGWVHPARDRNWRPVAERLRAAARRLQGLDA